MYRIRSLLLAGVTVAALGAGTVPAALAGTPTPSPSPSVVAVTPSPSPAPLRLLRFRPEAFIVHASTGDPAGTVFASGPVRGTGVGNFEPGPDVWSLTLPTGTVRVLHTPLGAPVVDPATCTATLTQTGRWVILGRSGADLRAFGFGTYSATVRQILPRFFGRCLVHARALDTDVQVLGTGRAVVLRLGLLFPRLTPALLPAS